MCHMFMQNTKGNLPFMQSKMAHCWPGELPMKKHKLVVAWIEIHQEELMANWQLAVTGSKLFPIRGLDQ